MTTRKKFMQQPQQEAASAFLARVSTQIRKASAKVALSVLVGRVHQDGRLFSRDWPVRTLNIWSGEAMHAEGVGNLAAMMDVMLDDVPDNPSASISVYLAFPLILDRR